MVNAIREYTASMTAGICVCLRLPHFTMRAHGRPSPSSFPSFSSGPPGVLPMQPLPKGGGVVGPLCGRICAPASHKYSRQPGFICGTQGEKEGGGGAARTGGLGIKAECCARAAKTCTCWLIQTSTVVFYCCLLLLCGESHCTGVMR